MFQPAPFEINQLQLSTILEELHDEVYVYDVDTLALVFANNAARTRCNWAQDQLQTKCIQDSSENFDIDAFQAHVEPLRLGLTDTVTIQVMHEKGLVEISTRILSTWAGRTVFVSVLRDREHRRQIQNARAQAFSEIVHDLRTPLTSILGAVKLLDAGAFEDIPPQAQNLIRLLQRNADNLLSIVGDILDLQKLDAAQCDTEDDMEPLDLVELTKDAITAHTGYCAVHDVTIDLQDAPDQAPIMGRPMRLHQLFANLLSNAVKNAPAKDVVNINLHEKDEYWRISISNGGPGIPQELRDSIFQSYVQVNDARTRSVKGTGLGLTICKKIVKSHGGEIGLSCDTVDRTTFYVTLPKRRP